MMLYIGRRVSCLRIRSVLYQPIRYGAFTPEREISRFTNITNLGFVFISIGVAGLFTYTTLEKDPRFAGLFGGTGRFFRSIQIGINVSYDYWKTLRLLNEDEENYLLIMDELHQRSADKILDGCLKNGGVYIKLGQSLVNLDHVLPKQYPATLKVLQDRCLPGGIEDVREVFQTNFGASYTELFQSFDETPIAAASLAQVFKAKTKDGQEVAVKVQYAGLRKRFSGDILVLKWIFNAAGYVFPKFDFAWLLYELQTPLKRELDFLQEGKNSERCAKDLKHLPYVYVPKVYWDLTSEEILTTEFINGIKITNTEELLKNGYSLAEIDKYLFTTFAEQIFHTGFIHADPHPGNLLIRRDPGGKTQLVLLDHGLYETLPINIRNNLANLWRAVIYNNHDEMKEYCSKMKIPDDDYRLFCIALTQKYVPDEKCINKNDDELYKLIFDIRALRMDSKNYTDEEKAKIRKELSKLQDRLMVVFKSMPSRLLLVNRNLNAVRAIATVHGNPIDRQTFMAECATKRAFISENENLVSKVG